MLIDRKLSTAEKLRKIGNFEQAIIIYEEILSKFPLNKRAQLGKSSCIEYAPQMPNYIGDVAELADALDLGSSSFMECRFDSCHPHFDQQGFCLHG